MRDQFETLWRTSTPFRVAVVAGSVVLLLLALLPQPEEPRDPGTEAGSWPLQASAASSGRSVPGVMAEGAGQVGGAIAQSAGRIAGSLIDQARGR